MRILEIYIKGFGIHNDLTINLSENINVILGDNESGKSTIGTFIYTMFYGFESSPEDKRIFYRPWDRNISYGGSILLECAGTVYKIDATFGDSPKDDSIVLNNISLDKQIDVPSDKSIGEILLGVSKEAFSIASFMTQNSSKLTTDNISTNEMFDYLLKKNIEKKQSSDEIVVIERLDAAINSLGSLEDGCGKLATLNEKKEVAEFALSRIEKAKNELNSKKDKLQKLESELSEIMRRDYNDRNDTSVITQAVEVVSLHSEIKKCVVEINKLDDELALAVKKSKKIRKPIDIIYIIMMVLCFLSFIAIFFSNSFLNVSFLASVARQLVHLSKLSTYIIILLVAVFVSIWNMILTHIFNKPVHNLTEALTEKEEDLFDILNVEYFPGSKNRQYNRDNINIALEKHKNEYKFARSLLEDEDNKEKEDNFQNSLVEEYKESIAEINSAISAAEESIIKLGSSDELQYTIDEVSEQIENILQKKESLLMAKEVMQTALKTWHAESAPSYVEDAGKFLNVLTDGKYDSIKLSRNFEISLLDNNSNIYSSASYGGATVDQIYLALRLSLVKVLSSPENMLPIILDDTFVQFDNKRKKIAYDVINKYSVENSVQIIMTSCTKDVLLGDFNIIELDN